MCLEVRVEPGQLIGVCRREAFHQVVGVAEVREPIHRVVCSGMVASELVFKDAVHAQAVLSVARVEGTVAWVFGGERKAKINKK